ncbi:MAG: PRD domain-containing protein [Lachnospiraceae bacterium]|nr:PRD domain-containing protein [Lachnospiraceae bacterium]
MQKNIFNIIQVAFQKKLDTNSMNYARLVIHIQFFLQRLFDDRMLEDQGVGVYEHIKEKLPKEISCARQIKRYVENTMQKTISEEEIGYLALHISRVIS